PGLIRGADFSIPRVPLQPGINVVTVNATSMNGVHSVRRLLVSNGPMPLVALRVRLDQSGAAIVARAPASPSTATLPDDGAYGYRLLDGGGAELYRGRLPAGGARTHGSRAPSRTISEATVLVPALPAGTAIEFLDDSGARIGEGTL